MEVGLHANKCDSATSRIANALHAPLKAISRELSQDFGGTMEHLWIDIELIQSHAERRPPFAFRLQKRVGGSACKLTGLPTPLYENVGHYSVTPDFQELQSIPPEAVVSYVLSLIYASTSVLIGKQKKLGGFDAGKFRSEFIAACRLHGHEVAVPADVR